MKVPIRLFSFGCAYYSANQLQTRFFPRLHLNYWRDGGQKNPLYFGNQELISKFRFFDNDSVAEADAKNQVEDYLDFYTSGPLTKADLLNRISDGRPFDERFAKHFRIKRKGKDQDELFWKFGKIHGLENIIFLTEEEILKAGGNPWDLQVLINKANDNQKPLPSQNFDKLVQEIHQSMD